MTAPKVDHAALYRAAHPFQWRVDECDECSGSGRVRGTFGGGPYPCDNCAGLGWHDRQCVECGDITQLNEDDQCRECHATDGVWL